MPHSLQDNPCDRFYKDVRNTKPGNLMVFGDRVDRIRWIMKDILQQLSVLPNKSQGTLLSRGLMAVSLLGWMICLFLLSR